LEAQFFGSQTTSAIKVGGTADEILSIGGHGADSDLVTNAREGGIGLNLLESSPSLDQLRLEQVNS
jgi:hypothetical protein